jgi:benzodiazapine receptor
MKRFWQIINIVSFGFALVANYLTATQAFGLPPINEVSDRYATALTPATYAFSIWSLIYLMLTVFVVYQARDLFRPQSDNDLPQRAGPLFTIASLCNGLWTYVFLHELIGLSVIILLALTGSLYLLLWRLRIAVYDAPPRVIFYVWWPLLLYTGWVTVASLVNISNWLASLGTDITSTVAGLAIIGLGAALMVLLVRRNVRELLLASIWGIAAIGVRQLQTQGSQALAYTAFGVGGVLLVAVLVHGYRNRKSNPFLRTAKER